MKRSLQEMEGADNVNGQTIHDPTDLQDAEPAATAKSKPRNAFEALMSPATQVMVSKVAKVSRDTARGISWRDGLETYIDNPGDFPASIVIRFDKSFVIIHDKYPKSSVHLLLLPRDPEKQNLHPFEAFEDRDFLALVKAEAEKTKSLAAAELRRRFGRLSAADKIRNDAMEADELPEVLPQGRNWENEVLCGIHAHPSMNHLHIHVISRDRCSDAMRKKKHYNSFATPFFVPLEDFPLAKDDRRRHPGRESYLDRDLECWRCGESYGNKFSKLKEHLKGEFDEWVKE